MKLMKFVLLLFTFITVVGCNSTKKMVDSTIPEVEEIIFDTLEITAADVGVAEEIKEPILPYNPSATRTYDLIHTKLQLKFNWTQQEVLGIADLTIKPIFRDVKEVALDAKGMVIHSVKDSQSGQSLEYKYQDNKLKVQLATTLKAGNQVIININYTARPNASEGYSAGAITSDKGLFFIDPLDEDPNKPSQIWTQGETENNSRWFPTFDKPNERCTQEIYVTVDQKYKTLSNGSLMSSTENSDGTRTDYWKQDKPHAPYLFMLAIGEFAWIDSEWEGMPLHYLVEPEYRASAKAIFDHTPEMLSFFSEILNYKYPWDKYAQVVTRDYVSGAMENTSAVIFGDFVQKHERDLIDNDNDYIVAHEMFHHWFGDLVTCESWANLTLNEGFANYSEYLWAEHHDGRMRADNHRLNEMEGYLGSDNLHPLIHYRYGNKEDMFDAHSYNKGGLVLHMLRYYVGEKAFFASLNKYLTDNAYSAVEVDELRMAFEDVTGEDLHWFFDQWYMREGHPIINVSHEYDATDKSLKLYTFQAGQHTFKMPFNVAVFDDNGNKTYHEIWIENEYDTLKIEGVGSMSSYVFDGENTSLAIITEEGKTDDQYLMQFKHSNLFYDKYSAFNAISFNSTTKANVVELALKEDYHLFKEMAIEYIMESGDSTLLSKDQAMALAQNDPHSSVRMMASAYLVRMTDVDKESLLKEVIQNEKAYPPISQALVLLSENNPTLAQEYAVKLKGEKTGQLSEGLSRVFADSEKDIHRDWYDAQIKTTSIYNSLPIYLGYSKYLNKHDSSEIGRLIEDLKVKALDNSKGMYERYFSTLTVSYIRNLMKQEGNSEATDLAQKAVELIKSKEQNEMLQGFYMQM